MTYRLFVLLMLCFGLGHASVLLKNSNLPPASLANMSKAVECIMSQSQQSAPKWNLAASKDGLDDLRELWDQTHFIPLELNYVSPVLKVKGKKEIYELRGFSVKTQGSEDADELVLRFNAQGELISVQTALEFQKVSALIRGAGDDITDLRRRQMILDFLANYRTAYVKKDLSYIDKVMNDKALIIVGRVLEEKSVEGQKSSPKVELNRMNKTQYMDQLRKVFAANSAIRIEFDSIQIAQPANPNLKFWYGVKMTQTWTSLNSAGKKNYSDEGQLFLLINFQDDDRPEIWVRSWQPKESIQTEDQKIGIGDFPFD